MKSFLKTTSLVITFFSVILASCQKQANDVSPNIEKVNFDLVKEVSNMQGLPQKLAYLKLDKYEKSYIWQSKLTNFISLNELNEKQKSVLNKIKEQIMPDIFTDEVAKRKFLDNYYKTIETNPYFYQKTDI